MLLLTFHLGPKTHLTADQRLESLPSVLGALRLDHIRTFHTAVRTAIECLDKTTTRLAVTLVALANANSSVSGGATWDTVMTSVTASSTALSTPIRHDFVSTEKNVLAYFECLYLM